MFKDDFFDSDMTAIKGSFENPPLCVDTFLDLGNHLHLLL